jgi:Zn-dependent metalloprotease
MTRCALRAPARARGCGHDPIQCIVPPYITERLLESPDPDVRLRAVANVKAAVAMRAMREMAQAMPAALVSAAPQAKKNRLVYDSKQTDRLPGTLARAEGQKAGQDVAVNEAYDFSGDTYDFYDKLFGRNSLDNKGMTLISSVHVAETDWLGRFVPMSNAFWNGRQMAYGDGDDKIFQRFTRSLEVVGHELTHGVQSFTSNLTYFGQSGALNEHFSDVFGILVRQWRRQEKALAASWVIGADVMVLAPTRRGIRDMENPGTAFVKDPDIGTDPQPAHMSKIFTGPQDRGGVHINSGIPNRAFVLTAQALKGNAWDVAGRIWFEALLKLDPSSQFLDCAKLLVQVAASHGAAAQAAVQAAWKQVGITV